MRLLACLFLVAACLCPSPAAGGSFARAPLEDVGIPFWCDWGYDWDERCYRDDTARLPVGGVDDKVWRGAVRFSLDEREVDFDPVATASTTVSTTDARWSSWDLTGLVSDWAIGVVPNRGVLLKLAEEEEDFGVSGPYFPSASFGTAALRARLVVSYVVPTTGLSP
jgi:hypothetical protein